MKFEYIEPKTLKEAFDFLGKHGKDTKVLAGGTDLLVRLKRKEWSTKYLLNIKRIKEEKKISLKNGHLSIGMHTTLTDIIESKLTQDFLLLKETAKKMASYQIRNIATVVGNICNASPAADMALPLLVFSANIKAQSKKGTRLIPIEKFFVYPGKTKLSSDELVTEILVPKEYKKWIGVFLKHELRNALDIAMVNLALLKKGSESFFRIAIGACAATPIRAKKTEEFLAKGKLNDKTIMKASEIAVNEVSPIDDIRAGANHRREIVKVFVKRALESL